jgi:hypothetical protein
MPWRARSALARGRCSGCERSRRGPRSSVPCPAGLLPETDLLSELRTHGHARWRRRGGATTAARRFSDRERSGFSLSVAQKVSGRWNRGRIVRPFTYSSILRPPTVAAMPPGMARCRVAAPLRPGARTSVRPAQWH